MSVKIETVEKNRIKLVIEVSPEGLEEGLAKSFKKNAGRFSIPGFRKGKAPRGLVERQYGVEVLYEDAINAICPEYYDKAIEENNIEPVDRPELDIVEMEKGKPFIFTATVFVKPEVTLGQYTGVEAHVDEVVVTDDMVEEEVNRVRDRNSRLVPVEDRPAQDGDTAVIDFEGFVDGVPFEGGKGADFNLTLGSKQFIPGFEDQLCGHETGEHVAVRVSFPEEYHAEELKGKEAVFEVDIQAIKVKELPELDDEFAQDVSEFNTLEEYRADIRRDLTEKGESKAKTDFDDRVIEAVVEAAEVDLPAVMIEDQKNYNLKNLEMSLAYQGLELAQYMQMMGISLDDFNSSFEERARKEVILQLVIEKVGKVEDIQVTEEDIAKEIEDRAAKGKKTPEEYKEKLSERSLEAMKDSLKYLKTIDFICQSAKKI